MNLKANIIHNWPTAAICLTACLLNAGQAAAEAGNAPSNEYEFFVVSSSIGQFADTLIGATGARIELSDGVRARLSRQRLTGDLGQVLDQLAAEYELDWFVFNNVYYVSSSRESTVRVIRPGHLGFDDVQSALSDAGLMSAKLSLLKAANGEAVVLSGPPKLLALAEVVIESIPDTPRATNAGLRVRRANQLSIEPVYAITQESTE